jgi:tetratricopeptide (TPR) repeat protein
VRRGDPPRASKAGPAGLGAPSGPASLAGPPPTGALAASLSSPPGGNPAVPVGQVPLRSVPAPRAPSTSLGGRSGAAPFGGPPAPPGLGRPTGAGISARPDVSDLGGSFDRFGPSEPSLGGGGRAAAAAAGAARCQVCGVELTDEFDKVIGLCETHQRERSGQSSAAAPASAAEPRVWRVRQLDGSVSGPFTATEIVEGLDNYRFGAEDQYSRDGIEFSPLSSFSELRSRKNTSGLLEIEGKKREARAANTKKAAPRASASSSISPTTVALAALVLAAASGAAFLMMNPDLVESVIAQVREGTRPKGPLPPNPLRRSLDKWRLAHPDASGTPDEHLATARARMLEDTWRAHQQAQDFFQRVLLLDEDNPLGIAGYVENQVLWRGTMMTEEELRTAEAAVKFAVAVRPDAAPVLRARAAVQLARGDLSGCRSAAERARELDRGDGLARLYLASSYLEGNVNLAIQEAEAARDAVPQLRRADRVLARAYANAGRYHSAVRVLDKRQDNDPGNAAVLLVRADVERELGNFEEARRLYKQASEREGDVALARLRLGEMALELGDRAGAEDQYKLVAEAAEATLAYRAEALAGWARASLASGKRPRADELARQALQLQPKEGAALLVAAEVALAAGSATTAIALAERVLEVRAGEPAALVVIGRAYLRDRKVERAVPRLEEAVQNDPRDLRLRGILASAYLAAGGSSQAFTVMRRLAEVDPAERDARPRRGLFALSDDAVREAMTRFHEAAREAPERSVALSSEAAVAFGHGDRARARDLFLQSLDADETNPVALIFLAQLAIERGATEEAERLANQVLRSDRSSAPARLMLGRVAMARGKLREANDELEAALRSQKGLLAAEVERAGLLLREGQKDKAVESLQRLYTVSPQLLRTRRLLLEAGA